VPIPSLPFLLSETEHPNPQTNWLFVFGSDLITSLYMPTDACLRIESSIKIEFSVFHQARGIFIFPIFSKETWLLHLNSAFFWLEQAYEGIF